MTITHYVLSALGLLILGAGSFAFWATRTPDRDPPSGPHPVGTLLLTIPAASRELAESLPPSGERGRRELAVRVWYPAKEQRGPRLTSMDGRVSEAFGKLYGFPSSGKDGPPSDSYEGAPLADDGAPHPVVVFSHGAFSDSGQNLSTMQDLASHGFVVFSTSHPGESVMTLYPEGRSRGIDPELADAMKRLNAADGAMTGEFAEALSSLASGGRKSGSAGARRLGDAYSKMFAPIAVPLPTLIGARQAHLARVLEAVEGWNFDVTHPLGGALDTTRLGIFGHSLGGYSAIRFALGDPRPRAVISLDVPYFLLSDDPEPKMRAALLSLYADETPLPGGNVAKTAGANRYLCPERAECLDLEVEGAAHMNFSDMNFLPRLLRLVGVLGAIDGGRASTLTNDLVVSFFDRHLRSARQQWLDAPTSRYSELRVID